VLSQFMSLASVGLAAGLGDPDAAGEPDTDPDGEPDAAGALDPVGAAAEPDPDAPAVGVGVGASSAFGTAIPLPLLDAVGALDTLPDGEAAADADPLAGALSVAVAEDDALGLPLGLAPGVALPVGDDDGEAAGAVPCSTSTGRNSRAAACSTESLVALSVLPGRVTTMFLSPWVVISASETPDPLMRCRMIFTASSSVCWVIVPLVPGSGTAWITISVPPSRSRPSLGVHCAFDHTAPAPMTP